MTMPRVSVVIPSFNHASFVGEAVRSVLDQTLSDLELIVVDDGSTDSSLDVLRGISDPRLQVVAQPNRGAPAALNAGLERARGLYLAVLNSDDAYHPERLARLVAALEGAPEVGLAGSYIDVVDAAGRRLGTKHGYRDLEPWLLERPELSFRAGADLRAVLLTENFWSTTSNFVLRRTVFERLGPFRPLRYTHDWDFALRAAALAPMTLLPEALLRYRRHERNTIRENHSAMIFELCWCLAVHLPQHLADRDWFAAAPRQTRVEQLLHSISVYGCDRVLAVMLLERLSERPDDALALLSPDDRRRARYLEFIDAQVGSRSELASAPSSAAAGTPSVSGWIGRLRALVR
jgi:glycosyltransferase involved in cell wall biosynthesis